WSGTPVCSIIPANIPGVLLGDWIYELSVRRLSRPLPTALRVPYVYVPSSALFWTLLGAALQLLQDRLLAKSLSPRELRNLWRLIVLLVALTLGFTLIWTLDILLPAPPGGSPSLPQPLDVAYELVTLLPFFPAVASLAPQFSVIKGRPLAAFVLGFLTMSLMPCGWVSFSWPRSILGVIPAIFFGLGAAFASTSRDQLDDRAIAGYLTTFLTWWACVGLLVD
ncbi:MAG: hypothetical protein QI223_00690, partial [Candidatus Korarchaeota archaeon]|nr:hypothetical protein [Candidatus Korarchaeota archaeon]